MSWCGLEVLSAAALHAIFYVPPHLTDCTARNNPSKDAQHDKALSPHVSLAFSEIVKMNVGLANVKKSGCSS